MKHLNKICVLVLFFIIFIPSASANIFNNSDFENYGYPVPQWTSYGDYVELGTDSAHDGTYGCGLWIPGNIGVYNSYISQTVIFQNNETLSYWIKTTDVLSGNNNYFEVVIGTDTYRAYTNGGAFGWTQKSIDVSGYTGQYLVKFKGHAGSDDTVLISIDTIEASEKSTYKLSGYVKNNYGNTVSSAHITLNASGGSTTSNDTGYYEITGISPSTYSITTTSPTHQDYSDTVSITANTEKNISMTRLTPALSNVGIIDSSESTLRIGWKENAVVDSVRIYQGTNTNLIATEDTSYVSLASYTVGNLDADTGYNFWLEPWDDTISGSKYYVTGTTDGDGGGGGGGGGDPTPTATGTLGPTAPPWTNITDEDWLNLTQYEQEYILQEHDNISIGTYTPIPTERSFWYLILFIGICSTACGYHRNDGGVLFVIGIVIIVISAIKLHLF